MPGASSRRADFSTRHSWHKHLLSRQGDKSGRSELATGIYATDNSHPFSCISMVQLAGA
jgi:hypothetical protein